MAKLKIENLKAGYDHKIILQDVSMEVQDKEIRIILGGSGCGKSTLLKNIIGLEKPLAGQIEILNRKVNWTEEKLPPEAMRKIGVLFQGSALLSSLSVGENVALPLRIHHPELSDDLLEELVHIKLDQVRMSQAYHKMPSELSGGMKKRAGLARAIVTDPELLFCDEPSAGLDPLTSRSLDELLLELRDTLGFTMVIVTHELDSIKALCDKMTFLENGKVLFDGSFSEAKNNGPEAVKNFLDRHAAPNNRITKTPAFHWTN